MISFIKCLFNLGIKKMNLFKNLILLSILKSTLFSLTIDEKVGQVIMCSVPGEKFSEPVQQFIEETKIGGVILYNWSNKLRSTQEVQQLTKDLQCQSIKSSSIPLFIGIDEEGGRVQRLWHGIDSAEQVARSKSKQEAFYLAKSIGSKLGELGINLNFSPVVDINSNKENIIIKDRAFSSQPKIVIDYARAYLKGFHSTNIFGCIKHFPGHGDVKEDSHHTLPVSYKSYSELEKMELIPYFSLAHDTSLIMTAHILFPNVDPNYPTTLSRKFLQDILRKKIGYRGIIITDSLRMKGILNKEISEIAIDAFNAGNDILLFGGSTLVEKEPLKSLEEIKHVHKKMVEAVLDGRISQERLEESVERILAAKQKLRSPFIFYHK